MDGGGWRVVCVEIAKIEVELLAPKSHLRAKEPSAAASDNANDEQPLVRSPPSADPDVARVLSVHSRASSASRTMKLGCLTPVNSVLHSTTMIFAGQMVKRTHSHTNARKHNSALLAPRFISL